MYWLLSVPFHDSQRKQFEELKRKMDDIKCNTHEFRLPKLRVGTLDSLLTLSDDLQKYDTSIEAIITKILRALGDLVASENYVAQVALPRSDEKVTVGQYLNSFAWDEAQYPLNNQLKDTVDIIYKKLCKYDDEIRVKLIEYNNLKTILANMDRKAKGSLASRPLGSIINAEHVVVGSEYLETILVCIPRSNIQEWNATYETLSDYVVPRSSSVIIEDNEFALVNVTVFKKIAEDYRNALKAKKYIIRDFTYDPNVKEADEEKLAAMQTEREKKKTQLIRICQSAFSEGFSSWAHLKAIRVYVEAILRYGLPPNYIYALLEITSRNDKKVKQTLDQMYAHLATGHDFTPDHNNNNAVVPSSAAMEFSSYVYVSILNENVKYLGL